MDATFKRYEQQQNWLLPPSLEDLLDEQELVRVVNRVIDGLEARLVEEAFKGGGCPPYHPRMMLKVLVYAYCCKLYSCRKIAKALRRDVAFMWLSGMQRPDFNTVNRFRSDYLKDVLPQVYARTVELLLAEGYIRFEDYFIDGTKMEADASKHKVIWRKNTERYKARVQERVREILGEVDAINQAEDEVYEGKDLPERGLDAEVNSEQIRAAAEEIKARVKEKESAEQKEAKRKIRELREAAKKQAKYEEQEQKLGDRNSYSKTDPDATVMMSKDQQLKPCYNVQAASENGFVVGYSVSNNASDGSTFIPHMEQQKALGLPQPQRVISDAGYGYEENYEYLEGEEIDSYLKYPDWYKERSGSSKWRFHRTRFDYDKKSDTFRCPMGRRLVFIEERPGKRASGYEPMTRIYRCESCAGCEEKEACTRSDGNREIKLSLKLRHYQEQMREKLDAPLGERLRKRRGCEIETVFGDIKHNRGYRRVNLRGFGKVSAEMALIFMSYNLRKLFRKEMIPAVA
jgi:transposase